MADNILKQQIGQNLLLQEPQEPYCRLCLTVFGDRECKSICSPFDIIHSILEIIQIFADIEISLEDQYSKEICLDCLEKLGFTQNFRRLIKNSDFSLKNRESSEDQKIDIVHTDLMTNLTLKREPSEDLTNDEGDYEFPETSETKDLHNFSDDFSENEDEASIKVRRSKRNRDKKLEIATLTFVDLNSESNYDNVKEDKTEMNISNTLDSDDLTKDSEYSPSEMSGSDLEPFEWDFGLLKEKKRIKKEPIKDQVLVNCPDCNKSFKSEDGLKSHSFIHSGQYPFYCPVCNKGFAKKGALETHELVHNKDMAYQCEVCGKGFRHPNSCLSHKFVHMEQRNFPCDKCDKTFKNKYGLKAHMAIHNNRPKIFPCEFCNTSYVSIGSLKGHIRWKHKSRESKTCNICGKQVTHLRTHLIYHSKPFKCTECDLAFSLQKSLDLHMNRHTKTRLHQCDVCEKRFTRPDTLKTHKLIHGEKRFQCESCVKQFTYPHHLKAHRKRYH